MSEENSDFNKPGWKPKFQSEFSMGALDFNRYNDHLKFVEHWCGVINSCAVPELDMVQNYFAGLMTLYKLWRPIISVPTKVTELDEKIAEAKKQKRVWEASSNSGQPFSSVLRIKLADLLDDFHTKLMDIKQVIGLGIVVKKNLSIREKIRAGIKGHMGKLDDLPEA